MIGPEAHSNGRTSFDIGSAEIGQVRELLQDVFPKSPKFEKSAAFLEWLYLSGPDGPAIWCDAMTEGRTVAHYGSVPQRYHSSAGDALLYLSLHSATHVGYRGRGTFSALAEATYGSQQAKTPYVVGAIGVPNREAAPPRTRRLGWTLYETLPLRVSLGLPVSFA